MQVVIFLRLQQQQTSANAKTAGEAMHYEKPKRSNKQSGCQMSLAFTTIYYYYRHPRLPLALSTKHHQTIMWQVFLNTNKKPISSQHTRMRQQQWHFVITFFTYCKSLYLKTTRVVYEEKEIIGKERGKIMMRIEKR